MKIGTRIRQLRQESGMTLEELSKKSGIALATLSRVENEKMTGTLKSHIKICSALGITLARLYSEVGEGQNKISVYKDKGDADVALHDNKSTSEILAPKALDRKMLPIMLTIQHKEATKVEKNKVGTEKFVYVLSGNIEITIGSEKYKLLKGDSLYFNSSLPHHFRNIGQTEAKSLCVTSHR